MKDLSLIFEEIPKKRVAVIGDIMLDHYFEGRIERRSPEAEIPIVSVEKEWFSPGGAGNTAVNVVGLGATATLFGRLGEDKEADILLEKTKSVGIRVDALPDFPRTVTKNRIIVEGRHVMRFDCEFGGSRLPISEPFEKKSWDVFNQFCFEGDYDSILISDYDKGFITESLAKQILERAHEQKKIVIVDTKPTHFRWFKGCFCIKPNKVEAEGFSRIAIESLEDAEKAGNFIKKILETNVLLTLGPMGMMLFEEERTTHFTSSAKDVFDVTGAGDTVLAVFSLALSAGASMRQAADLANHAAGIVITKSGTTSVALEELKNSIS